MRLDVVVLVLAEDDAAAEDIFVLFLGTWIFFLKQKVFYCFKEQKKAKERVKKKRRQAFCEKSEKHFFFHFFLNKFFSRRRFNVSQKKHFKKKKFSFNIPKQNFHLVLLQHQLNNSKLLIHSSFDIDDHTLFAKMKKFQKMDPRSTQHQRFP